MDAAVIPADSRFTPKLDIQDLQIPILPSAVAPPLHHQVLLSEDLRPESPTGAHYQSSAILGGCRSS